MIIGYSGFKPGFKLNLGGFPATSNLNLNLKIELELPSQVETQPRPEHRVGSRTSAGLRSQAARAAAGAAAALRPGWPFRVPSGTRPASRPGGGTTLASCAAAVYSMIREGKPHLNARGPG